MRKALITLAVLYFFLTIGIHISCFLDGYISPETEKKYLRNINNYQAVISKRHLSNFNGRDSLSFIAKYPLQVILPFHKWYIGDVGAVKPWSELSKKLDSISITYKNPYK